MTDNNDRAAIVDYLAFSAPLSVMKDVHTFQEKGFEWRKFQYLPSYRHYQCSNIYQISDGYDDIPDEISSIMTEEQKEKYYTDLYLCYFSRLKRWISSVFGLVVGVPRGKGGFAYQESAVLYSDEGGDTQFGMLYWGGNKETFYIQISGKGCTHVFSGITPKKIYKWLIHLDIYRVKRLDLATDDYDGIYTCQNVPIVTGKVVGEGVDVKNPFQTITRKDVGINLRVTPIVLGDKSIMLDIESNAGSISIITDASDIILNERSINTTVQLNNGDTLLIGGLIQHSAINDKLSTPIASSIPVIGWLFDSKSESESENTMYTLTRARIVTPI